MMQKYDFTALASGAPQTVNVPGRYIKYVTGNAGGNDAGLIVTPGSKPGSKILLYPGQAMTLPNDGTAGPNGWTLANATGQATITGTVVIGNGKIDDNTLSGVVQVVDGGKARTLANNAFAGAGSFLGTNGANMYSRCQLWNPASNTNRAIIESLVARANANPISFVIGFTQTQLTINSAAGVSKLSGGAVSTALCTGDSTATAWGPGLMSVLYSGYCQAQSMQQLWDMEPIVLKPGYGLTVWGRNLDVDLGMNFQWFEEPNV